MVLRALFAAKMALLGCVLRGHTFCTQAISRFRQKVRFRPYLLQNAPTHYVMKVLTQKCDGGYEHEKMNQHFKHNAKGADLVLCRRWLFYPMHPYGDSDLLAGGRCCADDRISVIAGMGLRKLRMVYLSV